jgi:hypothetical protein
MDEKISNMAATRLLGDRDMAKYQIELPSGRMVVLDPHRLGDRRRLARIIAMIAWRLTKEASQQQDNQSNSQMLSMQNYEDC